MPYVKTIWVNDETPVNAENMNNIENGIEDLENTKQDKLSQPDLDNIALINELKDHKVTANPSLSGNEQALTSLQVGEQKFKIEGGGGSGSQWQEMTVTEFTQYIQKNDLKLTDEFLIYVRGYQFTDTSSDGSVDGWLTFHYNRWNIVDFQNKGFTAQFSLTTNYNNKIMIGTINVECDRNNFTLSHYANGIVYDYQTKLLKNINTINESRNNLNNTFYKIYKTH